MKTWNDVGLDLGSAKGSGAERRMMCPKCSHLRKRQHLHVPCLTVNIDKGVWQCWNCGRTGSLQHGWTDEPDDDYRRVSSRHTYLKPRAPFIIDKPNLLTTWFDRRGIPAEVIQRRGITATRCYFPQAEDVLDAIAFPYYRDGELINVKYRAVEEKYFRMVPGAERILYGLDEIEGDTVIWCEGEIDALSLEVAGFRSVVSVPNGAPSPQTKDFSHSLDFLASAETILSGISRHIIAVDSDAPGHTLAQELARRLGHEKCERVTWVSDCKDANEVLMSYGADDLRECIEHAEPWPISGIIRPRDLRDAFLALYRRPTTRGESTGWPSLDEFYSLKPGEWSLITGIPSHGKSSMLSALAIQLAKHSGWRFAICPPEQQPLEDYLGLLSQIYQGIPFFPGPTRRMSEDEALQDLDWLDSKIDFILPPDDSPNLKDVLELTKVILYRRGIKGLVIDPFNELDHQRDRPFGMNDTEYISQFISQVRQFARRNHIHVWVVAHPTKLQKDSTGNYLCPSPYDVSGSAHWFNKADNILAVFRDVKADDNRVQIHVQKVRFRTTGKPGVVELRYHQATGRFSEMGQVDAGHHGTVGLT
jgi:twinkle protein